MGGKTASSLLTKKRAPVYEPIIPRPSEFFVWRNDDYPMPWSVWNAHPECEIHLICRSEGTCHVGDHIGAFREGDLFIVGRDLPHDWVTPLDRGDKIEGRDVVIQFDEDRLLKAHMLFPELSRLEAFLRTARRGMMFHGQTRAAGGELVLEIGSSTGVERLALLLKLLHLLSSSDEHVLLSSAGFAPNASAVVNRVVSEVLQLINANISSGIRLSDCAAAARMTETSFSRFFRKNTGHTFTRYLSELRMAKACELLTQTQLPISQICARVGYENLSNFNRAFLLLRGMSPRSYRRLEKGKRY
ncbi:helix-turn-helix domain-containing protein [Rhizobium rhizogenes]|uniref:helix-turn-helix domain-containing protein n=1 Tax=Rhizobium rhizogenes TaxID=359 RepID=UPI0015724497|nr:AraC family transcriptional regulator [Rhizobium rhizogenes]NTI78549.1 AraC family transcriptional regulator [Rhizobium rhizogenes]